jgi:LmbE family N-acetylglucosaminyl deacetylase
MNPYRTFVADVAKAVSAARALALGGLAPCARPALSPDAPRVLVFAPHPDDECIVGALPLRLLREGRMRVIDVAVTQGSAPARKQGRLDELTAACAFLGFDLVTTAPGGLDRITPKARTEEPEHWGRAVLIVARILEQHAPRVVMMPHDGDFNRTHVGTHHLVMDALAAMPTSFSCAVVQTEYWHPMTAPNLMVESGEADVADLVAATACHVVEVQRNPYHLSLPAWMQDNVRRGGEVVGGQAGAAPPYLFATLYRVQRWENGKLAPAWPGGRFLAKTDDPAALFV